MKVALNVRNRALLGMAISKYEKLAKGTKANLTTLNLPTMQVQTALGCCEEIKERMASAYQQGPDESVPNTLEIDFSEDLVTVVKDAFDFVLGGHFLVFGGKTEAEKERDRLKEQLRLTDNVLLSTRQSLEHMGARARSAEKSVSVRKGVITRMKRRIAAGRCVCCQHEFKDLERHMKKRHPRFDPEKHVAAMEAK
jgi:hypothetical protein